MRFLRWTIIGLLSSAGVAAVLLGLVAFFGPGAQFARAQARWAANAPAAYQADIVQTYRPSDLLPTVQTCTMRIEVRAAAPPQIIDGACPEALDVTAIFARFSPYVAAPIPSRRCGYGGCVCSLSTFAATYDRQYGFPMQIRRDWREAAPAAGPFGRIVARLPANIRTNLMQAGETRTPCPPGTPNHTPTIAPIYAEQIEIRRIIPLQ
jgi:hypothetical protein